MSSEIDTVQRESKDRRNNIIVIVLSIVLVVMSVLFFMQRSDHSVILNEIKAEKDSIHSELTQIATSYDSLRTENDTINEALFVAQAKVRDLLVEVEQTKKVSLSKINGYQKQVTSLRAVMRDFYVQIDSLNAKNEQLMSENREVKEQYKQSEQEKQQLSKEKDRLQKNLNRAAMLEARELTAVALNRKSKETKVASRATKIRIYFVLGKNTTTKRGPKKIYARIMRPDQLLMVKSENDVFPFEDLKIQYSAMREPVYEGKDLAVAIFWDNAGESAFMSGEYVVNLFADGNMIGETSFSIK